MDIFPTLPVLAAFTIASWILVLTPGPDMTLAISRSLADGKAGGVMTVLGTSTGLVIHTLLVGYGISALIVASPIAFVALKTGGAGYLLYLAIQSIRSRSSLKLPDANGSRRSHVSNFTAAFAVNLLNPKVIIFFMTFLPQFVSADDVNVTGKLIFLGLWFNLMATPISIMIILVAEKLADWLRANPRVLRGIDLSFAGVFSLFAVRILIAQAR